MENEKNNKRKALIYCRVSSARQKNEGHGLDSQEQRCKVFANQNDLKVEQVFRDSFSGGGDFMNRPAMKELLEYLDDNLDKQYTVIFDDLKRFARDVVFHIKLRKEFGARDVELKCLNFNFEDTPEGEFVETILAAQGELERKQNARQVAQKQKARLEKGYWPFRPPPGYEAKEIPGHGKILHKTSDAKLIKEAFEGFESGRFLTQTEVMNFLDENNFRGRGRVTYVETVNRLLTRPIYAGIIEYEPWGVGPVDGHHKPIISKETFYNVQRILKEGRRTRTRRDTRDDFPLRGLVKSVGANKPYTAAYSTGRTNKYPYYRDTDKESLFRNKSFKKEDVEEDMREVLSDITPQKEVLNLTEALIHDEWEKRKENKNSKEHEIEKELNRLQKEKDKLTERIIASQNETVIQAYENKIENISINEMTLREKLGNSRSYIDFGTAFNRVMEYVKKPLKQWESEDLNEKRAIVQMVFDGPAEYIPNLGFGTTNLAPIYKVFEEISDPNMHNVETAGIEPTSKQRKHKTLQRLVHLLVLITDLKDKQNNQ